MVTTVINVIATKRTDVSIKRHPRPVPSNSTGAPSPGAFVFLAVEGAASRGAAFSLYAAKGLHSMKALFVIRGLNAADTLSPWQGTRISLTETQVKRDRP
jgi:hypothetical protein